jgi:hypothetical protein
MVGGHGKIAPVESRDCCRAVVLGVLGAEESCVRGICQLIQHAVLDFVCIQFSPDRDWLAGGFNFTRGLSPVGHTAHRR